ncbi:MAG: type II secretion system GspH family protein [Parachlamydia sp.]|nr:type II secretion system GspH family protein [Parachlamydia sp.]
MKQYKRRYITLIEIMIVMFLIALITGVLAYNYRGSLDEGKAFKTKAAIDKIETILNLAVSEDPNKANSIGSEWQAIIRNSPLVSNPNALLVDGWGSPYSVSIDDQGAVRVTSQKYTDYVNTHQTMFGK